MDFDEVRMRALLTVVKWSSVEVVDEDNSWGDGAGRVMAAVSEGTKRKLSATKPEFAEAAAAAAALAADAAAAAVALAAADVGP